MTLAPTPGQTVGPFFHYALPFNGGAELVAPGAPGRIRLHGVVYDGAGNPVPDALIELWQSDEDGQVVCRPGSLRRDAFTFTGWGRTQTDRVGHYSFATLTPGPVRSSARYFSICVFARGLLDRLFTRAYLPVGDLEADPVLSTVPTPRRDSLIAEREAEGYRFDIHLQGDSETVFFDFADNG